MRHPRQPLPPAFSEDQYEDALVGLGARRPAVPGDARPPESVREKLMSRVSASAARNKAFHVSRKEDRPLYVISPLEVRSILHRGTEFHVEVATLQPGAELSDTGVGVGQEVLVLEGQLQACAGEQDAASLGQFDHVVRRRGGLTRLKAGPQGARVYVRTAVASLDAMPPAERDWWAGVDPVQGRVAMRAQAHWRALADGVEVLPLHQVSNVLSMLVRAQAHAPLADHEHTLPEDCLMLSGDLFLGDCLLRQEDYQMAPVGVDHVDVYSDTGALFFVHGVLEL